jgi:hypothetical protein
VRAFVHTGKLRPLPLRYCALLVLYLMPPRAKFQVKGFDTSCKVLTVQGSLFQAHSPSAPERLIVTLAVVEVQTVYLVWL